MKTDVVVVGGGGTGVAAAIGGNVRVGLEDSLWIGAGQLAASNADQVMQVHQGVGRALPAEGPADAAAPGPPEP